VHEVLADGELAARVQGRHPAVRPGAAGRPVEEAAPGVEPVPHERLLGEDDGVPRRLPGAALLGLRLQGRLVDAVGVRSEGGGNGGEDAVQVDGAA
jgi:hypothetical protein